MCGVKPFPPHTPQITSPGPRAVCGPCSWASWSGPLPPVPSQSGHCNGSARSTFEPNLVRLNAMCGTEPRPSHVAQTAVGVGATLATKSWWSSAGASRCGVALGESSLSMMHVAGEELWPCGPELATTFDNALAISPIQAPVLKSIDGLACWFSAGKPHTFNRNSRLSRW